MKKHASVRQERRPRSLPILVEKDEDGTYVVECPTLQGCYSQGETLDEALKNIQEVIELILEDEKERDMLRKWTPQEISFHTITIDL